MMHLKGTKDAPAPRPNKRPRLGPSPTDGFVESTPTISSNKFLKKDPKSDQKSTGKAAQLDEYLEVMQSRNKKGPSWANEAPSQPDFTPVAKPIELSLRKADNAPDERIDTELKEDGGQYCSSI